MIYFDSTYLGRLYFQEHGAADVRRLAAVSGEITSCVIAEAEVASVFHRKLREGAVTREQFFRHVAQFDRDIRDGVWRWLPVTKDLLGKARQAFATLPERVFLRAADALHLACAREAGFSHVHTNDRHMLAAAAHFGLQGVNVISALP